MTLPKAKPTRKQRFAAALKLADLTLEQWRTKHYPVSAQHLGEVWKYEASHGREGRMPSADLLAAIDETIEKYLGA